MANWQKYRPRKAPKIQKIYLSTQEVFVCINQSCFLSFLKFYFAFSNFSLPFFFLAGIGQQMSDVSNSSGSHLISRSEWGARPSKLVEHFAGPAPFVIIHHSYLPSACYTRPECIGAMRSMQDFHQLERGWNDIGYSFGIGGDGMIYTGRGFNVIGAHAPKYNDKSVGICLIGDWQSK